MSRSTTWRLLEAVSILGLILSIGLLLLLALTAFLSRPYQEPAGRRSLNNVKQLALNIIQYSLDNDGHLPGWVRNSDGRFAHNVWDQQIQGKVKSEDIFYLPEDGPGIRSYSDPHHARILTYGLNGLLITPPKPAFDGRADFSHPPAKPLKMNDVADPADVILFAEMATWEAMPPPFGQPPNPLPDSFGDLPITRALQWQRARDGWIDISPRAWVENTPPPGCYDPRRWDAKSGVARTRGKLTGGTYGFLDGHVKFMRIRDTLDGYGNVPPDRYWSADNPHNMWVPRLLQHGAP